MQRQDQRGPALSSALSCLLAMAIAGCSASNSTTSTSGSSSSADLNNASTATASEISASVGSMTMNQSAQSGGAFGAAADASHGHQPQAKAASGNGCGTVVIDSENSQNQVTDETITYALPACKFTGPVAMDSVSITGTLELMDPNPSVFSFSSKATNLEIATTASGVTNSETHNGTRQLNATSSLASEANDMTTAFVKAGAPAGTLTNTLALSFTPSTGDTLAPGEPLPAGTIQASGTIGWTSASAGAATRTFMVSTTTPLVYDPGCATTSASPFDAGQLKVVISDGSTTTYARVTWTDCGSPAVVLY
jgi:hypothetical protein